MLPQVRRGLTLVESLISIVLVSALLSGILGAFIVSRLGVDRAKHRMMAMNKIREFMEIEIKAGFLGGWDQGGYANPIVIANGSGQEIRFTIEDVDGDPETTSDDLIGRIKPDPYPATTYTIGTAPKTARYKKVGFVVEWNEKLFGGANMPTNRERAAAYVAEHN